MTTCHTCGAEMVRVSQVARELAAVCWCGSYAIANANGDTVRSPFALAPASFPLHAAVWAGLRTIEAFRSKFQVDHELAAEVKLTEEEREAARARFVTHAAWCEECVSFTAPVERKQALQALAEGRLPPRGAPCACGLMLLRKAGETIGKPSLDQPLKCPSDGWCGGQGEASCPIHGARDTESARDPLLCSGCGLSDRDEPSVQPRLALGAIFCNDCAIRAAAPTVPSVFGTGASPAPQLLQPPPQKVWQAHPEGAICAACRRPIGDGVASTYVPSEGTGQWKHVEGSPACARPGSWS